MPAVTSAHNEGRWIGSSRVSDEVGRGHRPSPDQGHGSLCSQTMGRSSQIHAGEPRGRGATVTPLTSLKICTFPDPTLPVSSASPRLPSLHPKKKKKKLLRSSLNETNASVVIWAAEVQCQVTAKTTHRISWHRSRERQVKTERRTLPECQLGLYMRLHTPWNMCSMCPISCWAALFYCSVINPEICPNCHIFHCSDVHAAAVFKLRIMCFKVIDTSQIKPPPFFLGHWHMSNALNNTNNSSVHSVNFIITAAQGINKFSLCWDAMSILSLKQCPAARVERWHHERVNGACLWLWYFHQ